MSTQYTLVAPCFFGTESTLHFEVKRLGAVSYTHLTLPTT